MGMCYIAACVRLASYDDIASMFLLHFGPLRDVYYGYISRFVLSGLLRCLFRRVCAAYFIPLTTF